MSLKPVPSVRLDKWLWSVRLYKTRALAADACRAGHVAIEGKPAKASREVKISDVIAAQTGDITRTYKVRLLLGQRVSAAMVSEYAEELTPKSELEKKKDPVLPPMFHRPKGLGRPTKKDRRELDKLADLE